MIEAIAHPDPRRRRPNIAQAMQANGFVFLSGIIATDVDGQIIAPDDAERQADACFEVIADTLRVCGAGLADVVRLVVYLTGTAHYKGYAQAKSRWFPAGPPAGTAVIVAGLLVPGAVLEIEATAAIPALPRHSEKVL